MSNSMTSVTSQEEGTVASNIYEASRHENYTFDNVWDASTWLEHVVEEIENDPNWAFIEARVVWLNRKWTAGYTAVNTQGELFDLQREESDE